MHPTLIDLGFFKVRSYGLCLGLGFLTSAWLLNRGFTRKHRRFPDELAYEVVFYCVIFGVLGAKIFHIIDHWSEVRTHVLRTLFSSTGLTWYGGPLVVIPIVMAMLKRRGLPLVPALDAAAAPLALGYAWGRMGCLWAGDGCYGIATHLPWGMSFPHGIIPTPPGVRVHPTPIYELVYNVLLAFILYRWDARAEGRIRPGVLFCLFLIFHGLGRFLVEFIRTNPRYAWGLSQAQFISLGFLVLGTVWLGALLATRRTPAA